MSFNNSPLQALQEDELASYRSKLEDYIVLKAWNEDAAEIQPPTVQPFDYKPAIIITLAVLFSLLGAAMLFVFMFFLLRR